MAIVTMATVEGQTLTERQKGLAACACLMAQGDLNRLEPAVKSALDNGVTINELKEAFSQLYAYTGFPRSLNALGVLSKVLQSNPDAKWQEGKPWTRPAEWDDARMAYELGVKKQTQLSGHPFNYDFCPQDDHYLKSHLFGDIFAGDQLSAADREIVTVAALSGLEEWLRSWQPTSVVPSIWATHSSSSMSSVHGSAPRATRSTALGQKAILTRPSQNTSSATAIWPIWVAAYTTSPSSLAAATTGISITSLYRCSSASPAVDGIRSVARNLSK